MVRMLDIGTFYDDENEVNILMKISEEISMLIDRNLWLEEKLKFTDSSTDN